MTKEIITVKDLKVAYGDFVLFDDINFSVNEKDIFIIMGASGCGKSSMLRVLTGLVTPVKGEVLIDGKDFSGADSRSKTEIMKNCGVLYQSGALFSSMTLKENVAMALELYSAYTPQEISELASYKLALTGLYGFEDFYPSEISGGMKKRAALSRALALDPKIVYCDEPSAGLDPISSKRPDSGIKPESRHNVCRRYARTAVDFCHRHQLHLSGRQRQKHYRQGKPERPFAKPAECGHL